MFPIPSLTAIKAGLVALAAVGLFMAGWTVNGWRLNQEIAQQKADAANLLASETARVRDEERVSAQQTLDLEKQHAKAQTDIAATHDRVVRAVDRLGLFDAGARPGGGSTLPIAAGATPVTSLAPAGCTLSAGASDFLVGQADRADYDHADAVDGHAYAAVMDAWIKAHTTKPGDSR